jgi:phosphonate transport system permease protein
MATQVEQPGLHLSSRERKALASAFALPRLKTVVILTVLGALVGWSLTGTQVSLSKVYNGVPLFIEFFIDMYPPDFEGAGEMWPPIRDTIQMAIAGLMLSIIMAIPVSLMAASNTSPHPIVYNTARMFLNMIRAIPSLVWAIIVVASIGFGSFAGVIALGIAGLGTLGKLYSEAIEAINPRQVEAVLATGAGPVQLFSFAVLPQAFPLLISYTLLDFEANIRSATILGIVGAGGIGFELQAAFSQFRFHEVLTILIEIVVLVAIIDRLSSMIRSRLI